MKKYEIKRNANNRLAGLHSHRGVTALFGQSAVNGHALPIQTVRTRVFTMLHILTYPIATGHRLMNGSIHSSEANSALGLLLDSCGCSCPLRFQAVYNGGERWLRKPDLDAVNSATVGKNL